MANEQNLKPFKEGSDPRRNTSGANSKSITKYLKEFGDKKKINFNIETIDESGEITIYKGEINCKGVNSSINSVIASQLLSKAVRGDLKAIQEVLDRTEGKPKQAIELEELFANGVINVGYSD